MFNIFISSEFNFGVSDTLLALQNINFKVFLNDPIDFIGVCCYNSPFTFTSINWDFFPILFINLTRGWPILLPFKEKCIKCSNICVISVVSSAIGFYFYSRMVWQNTRNPFTVTLSLFLSLSSCLLFFSPLLLSSLPLCKLNPVDSWYSWYPNTIWNFYYYLILFDFFFMSHRGKELCKRREYCLCVAHTKHSISSYWARFSVEF